MSSLSVGIIGLPNAGKSTFFNALLKKQAAQVGNFPFTTIEPNIGVVQVPDPNLAKLAELVGSGAGEKPQIAPATIKFIDLAGLVKGASSGQGLGSQFLAKIQEVDALIHLVRAFENPRVIRQEPLDPLADIQTINLELILADLAHINNLKEKNITKRQAAAIENVKKTLDQGQLALQAPLTDAEKKELHSLNLLTLKKTLTVVNIGESEIGFKNSNFTSQLGFLPFLTLSARLEAELAELAETDPQEAAKYRLDFGLQASALDEITQKAYQALELISFYTLAGGRQVTAWPIKRRSTALEAAAKVHADFASRFIKAEVISVNELLKIGSWQKAREYGKLKIAGKDYLVQEKDAIEFKI